MVLTLKVKVKVNKFKVPNLIISILGKDETCLKYWTTLEQNYGLDLKGQGTLTFKFKIQNIIISILGKEETCLKFWATLEQNYGFDLEVKVKVKEV